MGYPQVDLLGADPNQRIDPRTGRAFVAQPAQEQPSIHHASLSGPAPTFSHPHDRAGMQGTTAAQGMAPTRQPTPDELLAAANQMLDNHRAQSQALMGEGAATGARDDSGGKVPDWLSGYMKDQ